MRTSLSAMPGPGSFRSRITRPGARRIRLAAVVVWVATLIFTLPSHAIDPKELRIPSQMELEQSIRRGIEFLIKDQNPDGSWGNATQTKDLNIYAPVPGSHLAFRSAVTALCVDALIEVGAAESADESARQALARGEAWLLENLSLVRRADGTAIYNVWSHAYGIQALSEMYRRASGNEERRAQIKELIQSQLDRLERYESVDGGWGYLDFRTASQKPSTNSVTVVNAAVLVALHDAHRAGIEPQAKLITRAVAATNRQRKPDFSYLYSENHKWRPMAEINRPPGSLGRSQACNIALRLWGEPSVTDEVLTTWLNRLVTRNEWLSVGRKRPIPHESWAQVAGYFFYFGHYYAARCIEQLPAEETRIHRDRLAAILVPLQEKDGSWWDYPLYNYHRPYGTAFALMSLQRCRSK